MPNPIYIILNDAYYKKNKIHQHYQESNNKIIRTFSTPIDGESTNKKKADPLDLHEVVGMTEERMIPINNTEFKESILKLLERK